MTQTDTTYKVRGRLLMMGGRGYLLAPGYLPHGRVTGFWGSNVNVSAILPHIVKTKFYDVGEGTRREVFPTGKYHSGRPYRNPVFPVCPTYKLARNADGGYPLVYVTADGGSLCAACATEQATRRDRDHWPRILGADVYYEGSPVSCDNCNVEIESAYGDPGAYDDYVAACEAENLEPHTRHMWEIHGCPTGPI